jgi:hypothetical protein
VEKGKNVDEEGSNRSEVNDDNGGGNTEWEWKIGVEISEGEKEQRGREKHVIG